MNRIASTKEKEDATARGPVVAIMGHIDHGKSTLLDYIRKTNIVEREAGGITQAISAYEVKHEDDKGTTHKITFIDTPGHEAFSSMRERGAKIADIAILVVSAEDGPKPQTVEVWNSIKKSGIPSIVAINKIDKPNADIEKTKMSLAEHEIFLENYGGDIPFVLVSAKTGKGVDELLTLITLVAEMENLKGNPSLLAEGYILEANIDKNRGIQATLVIKNGAIKNGQTVATGNSIATVKIMENFLGKGIKEASFPSPVRLVGFDSLPIVGDIFKTFDKKEDAIIYIKNQGMQKTEMKNNKRDENLYNENGKNIPLVIKADTAGSIEAIEKEVGKIKKDNTRFIIVQRGVGAVSEGDITKIADAENTLIVGFNTKIDSGAMQMAETRNIMIKTFDIIYKLVEWLESELEQRRPTVEEETIVGKAKLLKFFSRTREKQVIGGKVVEGRVPANSRIKIMRRESEIGRGRIVELQKNKEKVGFVEEGSEFGAMLESKIEIAPGDIIEVFEVVVR